MSSQALIDLTSPFEAFKPPRRVTVAQGAQEFFHIRQPGGYTGPWSADETPYMVEPMNTAASRRHESVCFIGPSRSGKTISMVDAFMVYAVTCDPGDMLILQMTQEKAREFSKTRIDRAIRYSPALKAIMSVNALHDNTHDKLFKHGMWLRIGWPTATQLSGSDYRYVALTDYDRMPDDVDGDGAPFVLALKRTQTFLSRGMCVVESSPGRELSDPNWRPSTPHDGPPCGGIVGIYNRSDRRRWYWPCPHCGEFFEAKPGLDLFRLPAEDVLLEAVRHADIDELAREYDKPACPHCGAFIPRTKKHEMNLRGAWLADGQTIAASGKIEGDPIRSNIAGFWLGGIAAAYQSWHSLVTRYLQGLRDYVLTGQELTLQTTVNTDQGMPYMPRILAASNQGAGGPETRKEKIERYIVPDAARFLVAAVDVQGGQGARFVVQVHAIGPHMEQWLVDRYSIRESRRAGVDGGFAPLDPASYPEDWDLLTDLIIKATYRLPDNMREMRVRMLAVDSGGEDGVTDKAYDWYRRLRREQYHGRAMLVKGASARTAPIIRESWVGSKKHGEKGDIPLYLLNTNQLKDAVSATMKRPVPGPGYLHIPDWVPQSFFDELGAEVRKPDGAWMKVRKNNEALDLSGYIRAACIKLGADRIDWNAPPAWARHADENPEVITREERRELQQGTQTAAVRRRVAQSAYLR